MRCTLHNGRKLVHTTQSEQSRLLTRTAKGPHVMFYVFRTPTGANNKTSGTKFYVRTWYQRAIKNQVPGTHSSVIAIVVASEGGRKGAVGVETRKRSSAVRFLQVRCGGAPYHTYTKQQTKLVCSCPSPSKKQQLKQRYSGLTS